VNAKDLERSNLDPEFALRDSGRPEKVSSRISVVPAKVRT
jgi:hypothetical protein